MLEETCVSVFCGDTVRQDFNIKRPVFCVNAQISTVMKGGVCICSNISYNFKDSPVFSPFFTN